MSVELSGTKRGADVTSAEENECQCNDAFKVSEILLEAIEEEIYKIQKEVKEEHWKEEDRFKEPTNNSKSINYLSSNKVEIEDATSGDKTLDDN